MGQKDSKLEGDVGVDVDAAPSRPRRHGKPSPRDGSKASPAALSPDAKGILGTLENLEMPSEREVEEQFEKLMTVMALNAQAKDVMRKFKTEKKWNLIREERKKQALDAAHVTSRVIKSCPEYVEVLKRHPELEPKQLAEELQSLEVALRGEHYSYVVEFLTLSGLNLLEEIMRRLTLVVPTMSTTADPRLLPLANCIRCFRALVNTTDGLQKVLANYQMMNTLVLCLDVPELRVRTIVAEMLASLTVCEGTSAGKGAHAAVVSAFDHQRDVRRHEFRLQSLVDSMRVEDPDTVEAAELMWRTAAMTLVNAIVTTPEALEMRCLLEEELLGLGLSEHLPVICNAPSRFPQLYSKASTLDIFRRE
ncbi:hypothetical protein M427DRAFT_349613 [Gonapodya prolifera JEL478]|uniref:GBD/FH3 domain-containing protein n=1 Tax=Gonapodya prolifera (strain JEL478) TaxID=1344416 RepID=A0A139AW83_GONPJ|nr:hypothetical protein M427DRAFT_349613 [Gonapodya prolifera JEL478]|eukprot:KXS20964.1 hypothetical protein M427DRAFT_349613 [Gonapodya prolifera JEL478]